MQRALNWRRAGEETLPALLVLLLSEDDTAARSVELRSARSPDGLQQVDLVHLAPCAVERLRATDDDEVCRQIDADGEGARRA